MQLFTAAVFLSMLSGALADSGTTSYCQAPDAKYKYGLCIVTQPGVASGGVACVEAAPCEFPNDPSKGCSVHKDGNGADCPHNPRRV
ncbi:unnamed protein product [Zymoseptoria tritici ST99CH_1A5]|uniref:Uncharacterized protein n=1 Tax=Zymoseptoria tritici ST99CH_1A5 TaxID=1276529 RepID=A0A1Y6LJ96_ZYMTR|nr:unnamed protein product [Zymoseptoria tritici ST99CH_1A5]